MKRTSIMVIVIAVGITALLVLKLRSFQARRASVDEIPSIRGQTAPDFALDSVDGRIVHLSDFHGKAVLPGRLVQCRVRGGRMIASTLILTEFSPTAREWLRAVPEPTKEVPHMPTTKELTIRTEDRPGTLAKVCQALAERKVNMLALQSVPAEGNSVVRF